MMEENEDKTLFDIANRTDKLILTYWSELSNLSPSKLEKIISDSNEPVLKIGIARSLRNFSLQGLPLDKILDRVAPSAPTFHVRHYTAENFINPAN